MVNIIIYIIGYALAIVIGVFLGNAIKKRFTPKPTEKEKRINWIKSNIPQNIIDDIPEESIDYSIDGWYLVNDKNCIKLMKKNNLGNAKDYCLYKAKNKEELKYYILIIRPMNNFFYWYYFEGLKVMRKPERRRTPTFYM